MRQSCASHKELHPLSRRTAKTPDEAKERFLEVLAEGATVAEAAKASGIARRTAYDLRQRP